MKEFKIRAWDKLKSKFLSWQEIMDFCDFSWLFSKTNSAQPWGTSRYDVEQWSCLFDKNGVEIYEGDKCLVSCKYFDIKNEQSIVIFKNGCFCFQYGCTDDFVKTYNAWDLNSIEVIGNIHERSKNDERP